MPIETDAELRELLSVDTIAVVGCSTTPGKAAHDVPRYLQSQGYRIFPVNPFADEILGEATFDSLSAVSEEVDLVEVFRPSDEVPRIVEELLERRETRGDAGILWLQLGIQHDDAVRRAEEAGVRVVQDRCLKVEHRRLGSGNRTQ
ncbi:putative CoA-binding protein [Halalkaliarchaeum sp. AArc-CO]|uniref:CoA-binding protein n=1 Tax=unclassified Halalkaliarchaeum TaxID=2678344 RepID=UPI00217DB0F1|nr:MULTISPECIES: CoA-binding protein [unclassified Halalkaliarchaeum]MDR5672895.1 CoA-binding protein [Halalkaliarchaeum sp. AArc-GB]UWG50243.1 putative CoA-binding protein [Halalkaliarchaeum sp. AArc-CO]